MDYLTLGAALFTSLFVVWGFFRGFWKSLAAVISLILAYMASILLSTPLAKLLAEHFGMGSINPSVLWGICGVGLFIAVGFLSRLAVSLLGKSLPIDHLIVNRVTGAILNGVYGASMVVFIVWALAFSLETVDGQTGIVKKMDMDIEEQTPLVVKWSRSIMAKVLRWNVQSSGASQATAEATQAFAENPAVVLRDLKSTLELPEFRAMISNPRLQELARNRDFETLKDSPEFSAFINHTAVAQLQDVLMPSSTAAARAQVADYMLSLWHDIDIVKNDPEVINLFEDSEIQNFIKGGGASQMSMSLVSKGRDLLALVSEKAGNILPSEEMSPEPMPVVYKWYDDKGVLNVTHLDDVPMDKRDKAILVAP